MPESSVYRIFECEDKFRKFLNARHEGDEWEKPDGVLAEFRLADEDGPYQEDTLVATAPHTTCFDCGMYFEGHWNPTDDEAIQLFHEHGDRMQVDIHYNMPLVDPTDWEWRYAHPTPERLAMIKKYIILIEEDENETKRDDDNDAAIIEWKEKSDRNEEEQRSCIFTEPFGFLDGLQGKRKDVS